MGFVIAFNLQKSTQNRFEQSFLSTITTGKLHGEYDLSITLAESISSIALSMILLLFKGALYGLNLIDVWFSVFIFIFAALV